MCSHCGMRNKGFAAVCLGCSRERRVEPGAQRARAPERLTLSRGARWALVVAVAMAGILGFLIVRTFRGPALEAADVPLAQDAADSGRDEVPTQATMPGAPDSGWTATGGDQGATSAPAAPVLPPSAVVAPAPGGDGSLESVRSYVPTLPRRPAARRNYSDDDLRTMAARRGAAATSDRGYVLALRQRRVDDLSQRLASARTPEERLKLRGWLDSAVRDLERAQRE
ncbi:MAG TPA: hypothetical protein VFO85_02265 [Vicinamibacteria bacterium]|nr:hypothetical protein [Vicinamibacteria bacterium]